MGESMNDEPVGADQLPEGEGEWALVEVFGHRKHYGRAREVERFGTKMLRVDVPSLTAAPLLAPVDLSKPLALERAARADLPDGFRWRADGTRAGFNWVVVGGESGPSARPFNIEWARGIIAQCKAASVPVFMKQLGADPRDCANIVWSCADRKGGDISEFPPDLRVREYPAAARV
jgi:Protein of unknown function (DUF5131)